MCVDFRWDQEDVKGLETAYLNSINITHLNLTADDGTQRPLWRNSDITVMVSWWIHLISGFLSQGRTSLSFSLAFLNLDERVPTKGMEVLDAVNELDDFLSSPIARLITSISVVCRDGRPLHARSISQDSKTKDACPLRVLVTVRVMDVVGVSYK